MPTIEELERQSREAKARRSAELVAEGERLANAVRNPDGAKEAQAIMSDLRQQLGAISAIYKKAPAHLRNRVCPIREAYETTLLELGRIYGEEGK